MSDMTGAVATLLGIEDAADLAASPPAPRPRGVAALPGAARPAHRRGNPRRAGADHHRARPGRPRPRRARRVLRRVAARPSTARIAELMKIPLLLAAGTELLHEPPPPRRLARPDPALDCTPAAQWPGCTTADAVVIGSGAGGAIAARTLARAACGRRPGGGAAVHLRRLRAPPAARPLRRRSTGTAAPPSRSATRPCCCRWAAPSAARPWSTRGTCYRTPGHVLAPLARDGSALAVAAVRRPARRGRATLQVAPRRWTCSAATGALALAGAERLGWQAAPLRRNATGCMGSCQCAVGCPTTPSTASSCTRCPRRARRAPGSSREARGRRILVERGRATGVRRADAGGTHDWRSWPAVVVAAGATADAAAAAPLRPRRHPRLGRSLAVHPAASVAGRFAEPVIAWSGVMQSVGIEELHARRDPHRGDGEPARHELVRRCPASAGPCAASWRAPTGSPCSGR